jgi:hypothetical protein
MGKLLPFVRSQNYVLVLRGALLFSFLLSAGFQAYATVNSVNIQSPQLVSAETVNLTTPVHFQATAESELTITGYVVYVDGQNVFQNFVPLLDAWVALAPGSHSVYIKAWDTSGALLSTSTYNINITGAAPPVPSPSAVRILGIDASAPWTVDNNPDVGGNCNNGSLGSFSSASDPNTNNAPSVTGPGLHLILTTKCQYDDSLFYRSDGTSPSPYAGDTNFLWDFWFYIPTTTQSSTIQAMEHDLYQAVQMSDGVHEFMFGSQCNYGSNEWQIWLPKNGTLTWSNAGFSSCKFSTGVWHHATYFLQRVTTSGYQKIPAVFTSSSDTNTDLRFGTLTIDGNTMYLGGVSNSTTPKWSPTLGVQHQLDGAASGVTIEEYIDNESLTVW